MLTIRNTHVISFLGSAYTVIAIEMNVHVATIQDIEPRIRKANSNPELITEDDLSILGGALLLCLRENDNGVSREYASIAEGRDLQQDVAESLANLPVQDRNPTLEPLLITFARDPQFYEAMHAALAMTFAKVKFGNDQSQYGYANPTASPNATRRG